MIAIAAALVVALACAHKTTGGGNHHHVDKSDKTPTTPTTTAQNTGSGSEGSPSSGTEIATVTDAGGDAVVYVLDDSVEEICFAYLGDGAGDWTDDLLGDNVLGTGDYVTVTGVPSGTVEVYAEGCSGSTWYGIADVSSEYTFELVGGSVDSGYYYYYGDSGL